MHDSILVTGGTGTLGRHVVRRLTQAGRAVRVLTRGSGHAAPSVRFHTGDLLTGDGIDAAVSGVSTIIHCAGSRKGDAIATQELVRAAERAGRAHLVYISVVGAERVPVRSTVDRALFGYFEMKLEAEKVVARSRLPWTTLRATQFHDLMLAVVEKLTKLPLVPVFSGTSFQPIDSDEVAAQLVELAMGQARGLAPDAAGPRVVPMAELVRRYLEAMQWRRLLVPLRLPGGAARAVRAGAILAPDRAIGKRTWEQFVADAAGRAAGATGRFQSPSDVAHP